MSSKPFNKIPLELAQTQLPELHQHVVSHYGRVEIDCPTSGETCVLLSKAELQSLEEALGIYNASAKSGSDMHDELGALVDELAASDQHPRTTLAANLSA